ncbi:MAG: S9 family peptidase [Proteobacteria bacterium]|nr:S9 family peptidase [Pseudomonadota bacterium]
MILSSLMLISCAGNQPAPENAAQTQAKPQPSKIVPAPAPDNHPGDEVMELWGEKVPDPYRWLEDASQEGVQAWMKAQDTRTREYLDQMPTRALFEKRMSELLYLPNISSPIIKGKYAFYYERGPKDERFKLYVRDTSNPDNPPRLLMDPNELPNDLSFGRVFPSPDGKLLAYKLNPNNSDKATMYIMYVETGETLSDTIENANWANPAWLKDGSGFYYTGLKQDPNNPANLRTNNTDVRFHKIGTPGSDDKIIIEPPESHLISISSDGQWLRNKLRLRRTDSEGEWFTLPGDKSDYYDESVSITHNAIYIKAFDNTPRYRIDKIDLSAEKPDLSESAWQTVVPEFEDRTIENFEIVQDKLFVATLKDTISYLDVYDLNGKWLKSIELPDMGTIADLSGDPDSDVLYLTYTSFTVFKKIYKIDPKSLDMSLWTETKTDAHPEDIVVEQLFATSKDGTRVPLFVLRHKNTRLDGTAKTIIYGYGGFNVVERPFIHLPVFAWLEQGGIYVHSILRGGGEYGKKWREEGMELKKQNTFDDFYAVTEYLIANQYTRPSSIAAYGSSNGGLLTGVALTQRPDLYGVILSEAPLLDMLRYQLFGGGGRDEYGYADTSEKEYQYLRAYSPYHNVKKIAYPSVVFLTGDSDDRVNPLHARKMTAAIQDATTSDKPVLLRIEKNAGHGGADSIHSMIEYYADIYSFLMYVLE